MIPLIYIIRNLFRRLDQSLQLTVGNAIVILLIMTASAMNQTMEQTLRNTGDPNNVIIVGAGSEESVERSEVNSGIDEIISSSVSGIRHTLGKPTVSPEIHFNGLIVLENGTTNQALIRGVQHQATWVHQKVRLLEGNFPNPGEVMVGRLAHLKIGCDEKELKIGNTLQFNRENIKISGIFDAKGTVMEAEIWMPLQDLMTHTKRDTISCVVIGTKHPDVIEELDLLTKRRLDLEIVSMKETSYYDKVSKFYTPIRWMVWLCALLLSIGAILAGINSIYAGFNERKKEFGVLQAIGYSRLKVVISILQENVILSIAGLVIACFITLLLEGISLPYSIGVFELSYTYIQLFKGILTVIFIALVGTIIPSTKFLNSQLSKILR